MTQAADLILTNGRVYTPTEDSEDPLAESPAAVAVRDGEIVRIGPSNEVRFLEGVETTVVDLDDRVLLPGFVDAHTHLDVLGQQQEEADLSGCDSPEVCLDRLDDRRKETEGWIIGFGYDESRWDGSYLTRDQLDSVSADRPVVAFREDLHVASVNSVVLDRYAGEMPPENIDTVDGEQTGILVEEALTVLRDRLKPEPERMRGYLLAAQEYAHSKGVTAVHDMVRHSHAPRVYRELDMAGELTLRVRLNYWADHLDAVLETGLRTNHGSDRVEMGGIKTYADGSIGGRTARLSEPYADGEGRGEWVTPPAGLADLAEQIDGAGLQFAVHAIGDEAIDAVAECLDATEGGRHRIEHAEVLADSLIDRLAAGESVVSAQPNFLKWARGDGLYDQRLGEERRRQTNQFGRLADRGVRLAFGSDCMPLDPLFGIEQTVTAPEPTQRLDVSRAIDAYTLGGAYAGFAEDRLGSIERGKRGDFAALDGSPWETDSINELGVDLTVVDGEIVFDGR
jgi:predicted amidohydrolase YtcJ